MIHFDRNPAGMNRRKFLCGLVGGALAGVFLPTGGLRRTEVDTTVLAWVGNDVGMMASPIYDAYYVITHPDFVAEVSA